MNIQCNKYVLKRLENLLKQNKKYYKVDLHLHTSFSSDGEQTIQEVISRAIKEKFDVISITDHDSVNAYKDIYKYQCFSNNEFTPIVIPGVEISVYYPEYGNMCHILKYFFDENNSNFMENIIQNRKSNWVRVNKQFQQIKYNKALQFFIKKYGIKCDLNGFKEYIFTKDITIPQYENLIDYISFLLFKNKVTVWDVYNKVVYYNDLDKCLERRAKIKKKLDRFEKKYKNEDVEYIGRKLLPIIAIVGVDDEDYPEYEPSGNLTINRFDQVKIEDINNCGINIFAHPKKEKIYLLKSLKDNILGAEINFRSTEEENIETNKIIKQLDILKTIGSDSHKKNDSFYEKSKFYYMSYKELEKFYSLAYSKV